VVNTSIESPVISSSPYPPTSNITITTNGIECLLKNLKPGKVASPDDIPTCILRIHVVQVVPILQVIFTQSLNSDTLPND